jgi:acyl carrier protein
VLDETTLRSELKSLIVSTLNLEGVDPASIKDDGPLFGAGLGLDSVDALELMVAIEKKYGLKLQAHETDRSAFASVSALAGMVLGELRRSATGTHG